MPDKKPRRETPEPAVPLCRYEELAMRENRLRREKAAKRADD